MTSANFCYPVMPLADYIVWDGCHWLDNGYFAATNAAHTGSDFNKRTGGNTDLGAPVYSAATGRVIHCQYHDVWGWIIVTSHPGDGVELQYAHFNEVMVKEGDIVRVGQQLGTIGRGGKNSKGQFYFYAHLHFEVRIKAGLKASEWPSGTMNRANAEAYIQKTRVDPEKWLASKNASRTLQELAQAQAAAAVPPVATPATPSGIPENWYQVRNAADRSPIPGRYVSVWKDGAGKLTVFEVEPWKLEQRGIKA